MFCWPPATAGHGPEVAPAADLVAATGHDAHDPDHVLTQGTHGTLGHTADHTHGQDHETGQSFASNWYFIGLIELKICSNSFAYDIYEVILMNCIVHSLFPFS